MLDSLALRLVNGHGKAKPDRKLPPTELECYLLLCWIVVDSGDENLALCMVSCDKLNLHHPMGVSSQDTPAPIAYPICCIQVFKDNHRTAQLDLQFGERHPTTVDVIQVLHRIVKHGIIPPILFRSRNGVCTVKELDMPREGIQHIVVKTVNIRVQTGENGAICKVVGGMVGSANARIGRIDERSHRIFSALEVGWERNGGQ